MSDDNWGGIVVGVLIGLGLGYYYYKSDEKPLLPQVQRYEIKEADGKTFLLDTNTGTSWRFVWSEKDAQGVPNWYWAETTNDSLITHNIMNK